MECSWRLPRRLPKTPVARPQKIQHFELREFINRSGSLSWRVVGKKADGTRVRRNFSNRLEAIQTQVELEAGYVEEYRPPIPKPTRLSSAQVAQAEAATTAADGRSLVSIVTHYDALAARAAAKGVNLDAAIAFFESHYREEIREITVFNAYNDFLEGKQDIAPKTRVHYESSLKQLLKPDPNRMVHRFGVVDIEAILKRYKNLNSRRTMRRALAAFFNWAVLHHHCIENPCDRLDKLPRDMSRISVLSLDECKRLLRAAMLLHDGAAAATVAIGLFAGLRPSEVRDLKPEDVTREKIRVSGGKLRRQLKRSVPIPPVLATWLGKYPFKGLPAGWEGKLKILKKSTQAKSWAQDVIRHTSISFQAERDKNEALTAYNNGTSKEMMDAHYRELVDNEETVAEFWSLTPDKVANTKLKAEMPTMQRFDYPPKAKLKKLVWQKPLIHAAKDLGVSDVALKKHCVKAGIELPPRGHWIKL